MAVTQTKAPAPRRPARRGGGWFWSRLHFLIRFLGLTGLLVAGVGLVLASLVNLLPSWQAAYDLGKTALAKLPDLEAAPPAVYLVLGGGACAALALLVEFLVVLRFTAGRRSLFGFNSLVQTALAAALFLAVNLWAFEDPLQFDWTRRQLFTLPAHEREQLSRLQGETTIVVYQRHKTFGGLNDKPDLYDFAAERKVVDKVKDLVEQFRQVGPQFHVVVLDVEEEGYQEKVNDLFQREPALRPALEAAPENSLFFLSGGKVQQLSFNDFYQLDKDASKKANGGKGNLVLLAQGRGESGRGVEVFARKILNLEERKPRVGVLVVHELLTTEGSEDAFTLAGLRKALATRGFEVRDVVLKKGWDSGMPPVPAADTFEESKLERLEVELEDLEADVKTLEGEVKGYTTLLEEWTLKPGEDRAKKLTDLARKYARQLGGRPVSEALRQRQVDYFHLLITQLKDALAEITRERDETRSQRASVEGESVLEGRRLTDIKAKLGRALADCDLLLVPRLTRRSNAGFVPNRVHRLSEEQVAGVKEFLKAGKPLLACFGPVNEPSELGLEPDPVRGPDSLESLLGELGFRFGKQTVLFTSDARTFTDRRASPLRVAGSVEVPPIDLDSPTRIATEGAWPGKEDATREAPINPIREGLRVTEHTVGKGFDLRLRFPRPVYFEPDRGHPPPFDPVFLVTASGWNENNPFPSAKWRPHYEPPGPDDPDAGTLDARRRGAFPVGVAMEVELPANWNAGKSQTARVAVIGQGDVFVGNELSPAREQLFLETANWLLGRDDYLPRADHPWAYPRIGMDEREQKLWLWVARLGLPVAFAYLGLVVLLARRLR